MKKTYINLSLTFWDFDLLQKRDIYGCILLYVFLRLSIYIACRCCDLLSNHILMPFRLVYLSIHIYRALYRQIQLIIIMGVCNITINITVFSNPHTQFNDDDDDAMMRWCAIWRRWKQGKYYNHALTHTHRETEIIYDVLMLCWTRENLVKFD